MRQHIFIVFMCVSFSVFSQSIPQLKKSALTDAKTLATATLKKNKAVLLQYTHPNIRNAYGDQALLEAMEETFSVMTAQQIEITAYEIHEAVTVRQEAEEYQCLVTTTTHMNFTTQKMVLKSSLLGFYDTKDSQWYFIEANKLLHDPNTRKLFPDFKTEIQIPKDEQLIEN